jgi:hypothetical protein
MSGTERREFSRVKGGEVPLHKKKRTAEVQNPQNERILKVK